MGALAFAVLASLLGLVVCADFSPVQMKLDDDGNMRITTDVGNSNPKLFFNDRDIFTELSAQQSVIQSQSEQLASHPDSQLKMS